MPFLLPSPCADKSVVLKYITIYNKESDTMEEVLLEELQVFKVSVAKSSGVLHLFYA